MKRRYRTLRAAELDPPTQPIRRADPAFTDLSGWHPLVPPFIYNAVAAELGDPLSLEDE